MITQLFIHRFAHQSSVSRHCAHSVISTRLLRPSTRLISALVWFLTTSGFTLLGGMWDSRLPATPSDPVITFVWNGVSAFPEDLPSSFVEIAKPAHLSEEEYSLEAHTKHLITEALNIWSDIPGSYIKLELAEETDANLKSNLIDQTFAIIVESEKPTSPQLTAAFAIPHFKTDDPSIIDDCDITIIRFLNSPDTLLTTIIHELGHCLGLGHPHEKTSSIMSYANVTYEAKLSADDHAGIIYLYPEGGDIGRENFLYHACGALGLTDHSATTPRSLNAYPPSATPTHHNRAMMGWGLMILLPCLVMLRRS